VVPYWRLSAYYFFYFAFIGAFSPFFTLYLQSLKFSAWDIGVLMSLMQVMRLLAPNLWGWLADRLGAKTPIVRGAALMSLAGFSCFFFAQGFAGFFLGMALLAFFWSASLPLVEALTFSHLGAAASRYGAIRLWGSVGFILAVLGLGWLLDRLPLSATLWVSLALLGGILACALALPEKREARHESDRIPIGDILRRREVSALFGACFFMAAAHGALYVFYSIFLADRGYSTTMIGLLWTLGVVAEIAVFLFLPRLFRRFSLRAILLASFACAVARFLTIGWGSNGWHWCCSPSCCMRRPLAPTMPPRWRQSTAGSPAVTRRAARRSTAACPSAPAACWAGCSAAGPGMRWGPS
jgi:PPP family 3-phenylpropionic acid transporter